MYTCAKSFHVGAFLVFCKLGVTDLFGQQVRVVFQVIKAYKFFLVMYDHDL